MRRADSLQFGLKMKTFQSNTQRLAGGGKRRRNCRTETTRTPFRRAILIRSRSRLRSSSLVTKYCALPLIAASKISSSSGSRQILTLPEVSTTTERATISRTNISPSSPEYLNFLRNRGRLRTSEISPSWKNEVTTLKSPRCQPSITCPGGPEGFRNPETQTLVSSRATNATTFRSRFNSGQSHFRFDHFLGNVFGPGDHLAAQAFEFIAPLLLGIDGDQKARFFLESQRFERAQSAVFKHRMKGFSRWGKFFRQRHGDEYIGTPVLGQADEANRRNDPAQCAGASGSSDSMTEQPKSAGDPADKNSKSTGGETRSFNEASGVRD